MKRPSYSTMSPARSVRAGIVVAAVIVVGAGSFGPVSAEDEDTSSSVYLVFDPETGEFVTEDRHDAALPNQTGLEDSGLEDPGKEATGNQAPASGTTTAVIIGLAVLVLAGIGFTVLRRRSAA